MEGCWSILSVTVLDSWAYVTAYIELVIIAAETVEEEVSVDLESMLLAERPLDTIDYQQRTCGFTSTKSMNSTTKSCSTYLSANLLHRGHCVKRTSPPPAPLDFDSPPLLLFGLVRFGVGKMEGVEGDLTLPLEADLGTVYEGLWLLLWRT